MNLREVPPEALTISDMNERSVQPAVSDMVDSVSQQGVIQPPTVRESDDGLEVVVGQRRTLAAREAGLETLPVVVMDWNDADALEASITENVKSFREDVTDNERAVAVKRLMELHDESIRGVADRLGVSEKSVRDWLEASHEVWQDTAFEPEHEARKRQGDERSDSAQTTDRYAAAADGAQEASSKVGGSTMRTVRVATEDEDDETTEEFAHQVAAGEATQSDAREVSKAVDRGADFEDARDRVLGSKDASGGSGGTIGVQLTLPGDVSDRLTDRAETEGVSNEEVIRRALRKHLGISE